MEMVLGRKRREMTVLSPCGGVRALSGLRVLRRPDRVVARTATNVFVAASASRLIEVGGFVREVLRRHQLRVLMVQADVEHRWIGQMMDRAGLRGLRHLLVHSDGVTPRRILEAWCWGAEQDLIADATLLPDRMLVLSCAMERFEIPLSALPDLGEVGAFSISPDGAWLHWPATDVHLDMNALRSIVDPSFGRRRCRERLAGSKRYGQAIARLREAKNLTREGIPGVSRRQLYRIENGESHPRESTLSKLAEGHGLSLDDYLDAVASVFG